MLTMQSVCYCLTVCVFLSWYTDVCVPRSLFVMVDGVFVYHAVCLLLLTACLCITRCLLLLTACLCITRCVYCC